MMISFGIVNLFGTPHFRVFLLQSGPPLCVFQTFHGRVLLPGQISSTSLRLIPYKIYPL